MPMDMQVGVVALSDFALWKFIRPVILMVVVAAVVVIIIIMMMMTLFQDKLLFPLKHMDGLMLQVRFRFTL